MFFYMKFQSRNHAGTMRWHFNAVTTPRQIHIPMGICFATAIMTHCRNCNPGVGLFADKVFVLENSRWFEISLLRPPQPGELQKLWNQPKGVYIPDDQAEFQIKGTRLIGIRTTPLIWWWKSWPLIGWHNSMWNQSEFINCATFEILLEINKQNHICAKIHLVPQCGKIQCTTRRDCSGKERKKTCLNFLVITLVNNSLQLIQQTSFNSACFAHM